MKAEVAVYGSAADAVNVPLLVATAGGFVRLVSEGAYF
jgi:hypothetical protein